MFSEKDAKAQREKYLFSLIQKNDENAFTELYHLYYDTLYNLVFFYLKDIQLTEDTVQDTFVVFWESRLAIDIHLSLKNYLYTIAKNLTLKVIREKNKDVLHAYEFERQRNLQASLREKLETEKRNEELYEAINRLPSCKKEICLLKLDGKLNNQQIADKLGISIETVKSHYSSSIKMLKLFLHKKIALFFSILFIVYILL